MKNTVYNSLVGVIPKEGLAWAHPPIILLLHSKQKVSQSESISWSKLVTMHQKEILVITAQVINFVKFLCKSVDQLHDW